MFNGENWIRLKLKWTNTLKKKNSKKRGLKKDYSRNKELENKINDQFQRYFFEGTIKKLEMYLITLIK